MNAALRRLFSSIAFRLERLFPSLGKKIALAIVIMSVIFGGTFVYFAHRTGNTMLEEQSSMKAHDIADVLRGVLEHVMLEGKSEYLQQTLESVIASEDVTNVYILRADGSIALRARPDTAQSPFPIERFGELSGMGGEQFFTSRDQGSPYQYVLAPIRKKPECIRCHADPEVLRGYVALKVSIEDLRAIARQHRTTNILMTVGAFGGLGIIIFIALSILVISPIKRLHSQVRDIEGGMNRLASGEMTQFPVLSGLRGKDELMDLGSDFNRLVRRLNEANAKLIELHREQLQHADRLASTGEMAASMAHEIKNPLAGVLGALQIFDGESSGDPARREIIAEMIVQLQRVNHAVNDLLSYARPTPPSFEQVHVNGLIQKTVSLIRRQVDGKQIAIECRLEEDDLIRADTKLLQQALWNIILNATQAVENSGTVSIHSSHEGSSFRIRITDTGKGIAAEHLERVFKPFFTTKHKGTGLGMTISRGIVEQHNGSIAIESRPGMGTSVTVSLPNNHRS